MWPRFARRRERRLGFASRYLRGFLQRVPFVHAAEYVHETAILSEGMLLHKESGFAVGDR